MAQKNSPFKAPSKNNDLFNRSLIRSRRERIAASFSDYDFLNREISERLIDNLHDIKMSFETILSMNLCDDTIRSYFKDVFLINQNMAHKMLAGKYGKKVQADEDLFPYKNQCLELIISCLTLHWINDIPGSLIQIRRSLKPNGLFMGAVFGGETLFELRASMLKAGIDIRGGATPHVSPFIDIRDAGTLMQRAGFSLPVISTERITVNYTDAFSLMKELKNMGENNALIKRFKGLTSKKFMFAVAEKYQQDYGNEDGKVSATFDVIYMKGWAPHESQQQPLKPGTGKISLKVALGSKPKSL